VGSCQPALVEDDGEFVLDELVEVAGSRTDEYWYGGAAGAGVTVEAYDGDVIEPIEAEETITRSVVHLDLGAGRPAEGLVVAAGGGDAGSQFVRFGVEAVCEESDCELVVGVGQEDAERLSGLAAT
jgi:hypothetical protein